MKANQTSQKPRTKRKVSNLNGKLQHKQAIKYGLSPRTTKPPPNGGPLF